MPCALPPNSKQWFTTSKQNNRKQGVGGGGLRSRFTSIPFYWNTPQPSPPLFQESVYFRRFLKITAIFGCFPLACTLSLKLCMERLSVTVFQNWYQSGQNGNTPVLVFFVLHEPCFWRLSDGVLSVCIARTGFRRHHFRLITMWLLRHGVRRNLWKRGARKKIKAIAMTPCAE